MYKSVGTTRTWADVTNFPVVLDELVQGQQEQECLKGQIRCKKLLFKQLMILYVWSACFMV